MVWREEGGWPMRVMKLSTYGADQVNASRRTTQDVQVQRDTAEVDRMEAEARLEQARRSKPLLQRALRRTSEAERAAQRDYDQADQRAKNEQVAARRTAVRTRQREGGESGEQRLFHHLNQRLGDEWIMFQGYKSRAGEADIVLVGPNGVWVVEVKTQRIRLTADGDNWTRVDLGSGGSPKGPARPAVDGGGRTWGRQVSAAALALGEALERAGCPVPIHTAVVLMSRRAEVTKRLNPDVDLVTVGPAELDKVIHRNPLSIDLLTRRQIEAAIPIDHEASNKVSDRARAARKARGDTQSRSGRDRPTTNRDRRGRH
jgi:hypothetical protein